MLRLSLSLLLVCAWSALAQDQPKLFFSRSLEGVEPPYFEITVSSDGSTVYRQATDDEFPIEFQAPPEDVARLFEITEKLGYFAAPLAPPKRNIAFTGNKILRYTGSDGVVNEIPVVAAEDEDAQELIQWFLRLGDTELYYINMERSVQFDRLGVNKAVLQFHAAFNHGRVIAPRQFLPLLRRIANDQKILHLARSRAAGIAERIEAGATSGE